MSAAPPREPAGAPTLRLAGIRKSIGGVDILRGVDLEVRAGERHVLIGPNGAGKTTLFNVASGQTFPDSGSIAFQGQDVSALPPFRRARLGLARTFQIASLFRNLSVRENMVLAARAPAPFAAWLRGSGRSAELQATVESGTDTSVESRLDTSVESRLDTSVEGLLEAAGLAAKRNQPVRELAYGEQRQLEIALALASRPRMLLMDEPMAGLSPEERRVLAERIVGLSAQMPILMVEHDLDVALALAERISVLYVGEVVCRGTPDEVRRDATVRRIYLG
jgi:branched-chain amino acid transport system ATP-binding protein